MCDGSACPDAETPDGHDMPCMVMHHESCMHIMIMNNDDESSGRGFRKRGAEGTEAREERLGKRGSGKGKGKRAMRQRVLGQWEWEWDVSPTDKATKGKRLRRCDH